MSALPRIIAPQSAGLVPKDFQAQIIENICAALGSQPRPPCLLRSPTGSGKTFILTKILENIGRTTPVLWLWFVPYVNLVAQTVDTLDSQSTDTGLIARHLGLAQNEAPEAGQVLVSTLQGVASAKSHKAAYDDKADDDRRSLAAYFELARSRGLEIGLVVDEVHIALDSATEFGKFVKWLKADYLLMASATPKDARLNAFIASAGNIAFKAFSVSRAEVVKERLNKPWLETVVYPMSEAMHSITDLKLTVLRRAWQRNQHIGRVLKSRGLRTVPLMLVQVANGFEAIREAFEFLTQHLGVAPNAIGMHSADEPDPAMMAAIAVNESIEVLIFKQSAGTGFDAPRAFVLASTKNVNDEDFAMQFIGRVMRVPGELQRAFPVAYTAPTELDTAYIFLANELAQAGFSEAAASTQAVMSQLAGQIEELVVRRTAHGGVSLSNHVTDQTPLAYDIGLLATVASDGTLRPAALPDDAPVIYTPPPGEIGVTAGLFGAMDGGGELDGLDFMQAAGGNRPAIKRNAPANHAELMAALEASGLRAYPRLKSVAQRSTPERFTTEVKPVFDVLELDIRAAAQSLHLSEEVKSMATRAALNLLTEREVRTELFGGASFEESVQVVTDRAALMQRTQTALEKMGLEEQDHIDLIGALARRLLPEIERAHAYRENAVRPDAGVLRAQARDAACWVVHKQLPELQEALQAQWANKAREVPAQALPDALLMPAGQVLAPSRKNIYGVLFPATDSVALSAGALPLTAQALFKNEIYAFAQSAGGQPEGDVFCTARVDGTYEFNTQELAFAQSLDRADFVAWWHRNPQGKPYSIALMRTDNRNMFYPDFVVCLRHELDDEPLVRLVETKHDLKDASRKGQHASKTYGKVLFLTKDAQRFKIVEDNGSLGEVVDFDNLTRLRQWMRDSAPAAYPVFSIK
ncbi:DEAD/DEAH box helicase family protein [Polaromonas sp.]|uniref:DEAD/DEAH box helicase n=1 Tax=Polaromonas sp. TaxID=1869339 RepID=UPI0013B85124|nr:DEAD/DEAH box helicase family protein [Polaromonas sp.]NDP63590.1 DEAD/DEAH box helicase family protein [Polaromonas sp.]